MAIDPLERDAQRILRAIQDAIPEDVDARAVLLVCAELIRETISVMPLDRQPHLWATLIADMQDHAR